MFVQRSPLLCILFLMPFVFSDEATASVSTLTNFGFEAPSLTPGVLDFKHYNESLVPGWETTASDHLIEIWSDGFGGFASYEGSQHIEINATQPATLFQDTIIPLGQTIYFEFAHRARYSGPETLLMYITDLGSDNISGGGNDTVLFSKLYSSDNTGWSVYRSDVEPPVIALGNTVRISFESQESDHGGNFLDGVVFGYGIPDPICAEGLNNFNFETPVSTPGVADFQWFLESDVPFWETTASDDRIELWTDGFGGFSSYDGCQHAEINATQIATLFQDVAVPCGREIFFEFAHRARYSASPEVLQLCITDLGPDGAIGGNDDTNLFTKDYSSANTGWVVYRSDIEPPITTLGHTIRISFKSQQIGDGGNFLDGVVLEVAGFLFVDDFECGDTSSWSSTVSGDP